MTSRVVGTIVTHLSVVTKSLIPSPIEVCRHLLTTPIDFLMFFKFILALLLRVNNFTFYNSIP